MRPGTDSNERAVSHRQVSHAAFITCTLLSVAGAGCHSMRPGQTMMSGQPCDFGTTECSSCDSVVDPGASEFTGRSCGSCSPAGSCSDQNQWLDSQCRTADCNENCDAGCTRCGYDLPRELQKVSLPDYVIEPPDILLIEVSSGQKLPNAKIRPGELLQVQVESAPSVDPVARAFNQIDDTYRVQPDGTLNFGPEYGAVPIQDLTIPEARRLIELNLRRTLQNPQVSLSRATDQTDQPITGEHLVCPDGTVSLGIYGSIYVAGSTLSSVRQAIERHLAGHLDQPQIYIDLLACKSKVFYVVTDGGGAGEQVFRFPCTGNETVLDALALVTGRSTVASSKSIWIARPAPPELGYEQIIPVDWDSIVRGGLSKTNYQLFPGDRLYVQTGKSATFANITAPLKRLFESGQSGAGTAWSVQNGQRGGGR